METECGLDNLKHDMEVDNSCQDDQMLSPQDQLHGEGNMGQPPPEESIASSVVEVGQPLHAPAPPGEPRRQLSAPFVWGATEALGESAPGSYAQEQQPVARTSLCLPLVGAEHDNIEVMCTKGYGRRKRR